VLAHELSLDILPILIYGNGNLVSKQQPFYVKHGVIGHRILQRISPDNKEFEGDCREKSKLIVKHMREEYSILRSRYDTPENHFFYYAVLANYIYKGPILEWYMRIKIKMENNYKFFHDIIPLKASVTDIGCGYGPLCFMLGLLSKDRTVIGIDYDNEKIEIAANGYSANENIRFMYANALDCDIPMSDVFVLNDILHYLPLNDQEKLLLKCASRINEGGIILVRDGDSGNKKDHRITKLTEWFSINLLGFNKSSQAPCFTDSNQFKIWADKMGCSLEIQRNDKITSNTIYLLKK
jgi:SAM-dependent methyltransferase